MVVRHAGESRTGCCCLSPDMCVCVCVCVCYAPNKEVLGLGNDRTAFEVIRSIAPYLHCYFSFEKNKKKKKNLTQLEVGANSFLMI